MKIKCLLLILLFFQGCRFQKSENFEDLTSKPNGVEHKDLNEFVGKIKTFVRNDDFKGLSSLARFPLEIRGLLDEDRNYISAESSVIFFRKLMKESSGFRNPGLQTNPITGAAHQLDLHDKKSEIIESANKFNMASWMASGSTSIGPLVIFKTSTGWKIVAVYSDMRVVDGVSPD